MPQVFPPHMIHTSSTQDMKVQKNGFVKRSKAKKPRKNYGMVAHSSLTFFPTGAKVVFLIQRKNKQTSEKQTCGQLFRELLLYYTQFRPLGKSFKHSAAGIFHLILRLLSDETSARQKFHPSFKNFMSGTVSRTGWFQMAIGGQIADHGLTSATLKFPESD